MLCDKRENNEQVQLEPETPVQNTETHVCKYSIHTCMVRSIHKYKEGVKEKCEQWRNNEHMHLETGIQIHLNENVRNTNTYFTF